MAREKNSKPTSNDSGLNFEAQLWAAADKMRGHNFGPRNADSFRQDLHPDLKADLVPVRKDIANPPFSMSDWGGENLRQDVRCFSLSASNGERAWVRCRVRSWPVNNANYAWIQHFIHHLSPQDARCGKRNAVYRLRALELTHG